MRELSLFTGAGGGILGSKILGWKTLGYVEFGEYQQQVIAARIKDGFYDEAPIFTDIRAFISDGYARSYQGMVDVVTGGFPCQPFSVAGERKAGDDERDMWPATAEVIRQVRPRWAFLENVPGILSAADPIHGTYFGKILGDLASMGYDAEWAVLGADDVGAPHRRKRLWILASNTSDGGWGELLQPEREQRRGTSTDSWSDGETQPLADSGSKGLEGHAWNVPSIDKSRRFDSGSDRQVSGGSVRHTAGEGLSDRSESQIPQQGEVERLERPDWWSVEPDVGRVANGVANRVNRLKAIGNGQVPQTMAAAFLELRGRFGGAA